MHVVSFSKRNFKAQCTFSIVELKNTGNNKEGLQHPNMYHLQHILVAGLVVLLAA